MRAFEERETQAQQLDTRGLLTQAAQQLYTKRVVHVQELAVIDHALGKLQELGIKPEALDSGEERPAKPARTNGAARPAATRPAGITPAILAKRGELAGVLRQTLAHTRGGLSTTALKERLGIDTWAPEERAKAQQSITSLHANGMTHPDAKGRWTLTAKGREYL